VSYPGQERHGTYRDHVTITSGDALTPPADTMGPAREPSPHPGVVGEPMIEPCDLGISVVQAPAPTAVPCLSVVAVGTGVPAQRLEIATPEALTESPEPPESPEVDVSLPSLMTAPPSTGTEPDPTGLTTGPTPGARLRAALSWTGPGLTGPGGLVLGAMVVGFGALLDLTLGDELGLGFTATFLLGSVLVALAVRPRALPAAVVLPPLLFAVTALLETKHSGATSGNRQAALDVATTLALSAPILFTGTALTLAVVLGRLVLHTVRR
jgi:hypothetical protein